VAITRTNAHATGCTAQMTHQKQRLPLMCGLKTEYHQIHQCKF